MIYCSNCGKENLDESRFCEACGYKIENILDREKNVQGQHANQSNVSSDYPQQTAYPQWPVQGSSQSSSMTPPQIINRLESSSNTSKIFCTACGTINAGDSTICTKCGNSLMVDSNQTVQKNSKEPIFEPGTPAWAKTLSIIWVFLMLGSGLMLLIDGAAYAAGVHFLGFIDILIFGTIFLITFGLWKLTGRLPRSVRKQIRNAMKDVKLESTQNRQITTGSQFCSACGAPRIDGFFCESCGARFE